MRSLQLDTSTTAERHCLLWRPKMHDQQNQENRTTPFNDSVGNILTRDADCSDMLSKCFCVSNVIDSHNQARQFCLALEKKWIAQDCWFRIDTTFIGITTTDCSTSYKNAIKEKWPSTILDFVDRLAHDCIHNALSTSTGCAFIEVEDSDTGSSNRPRPSPIEVCLNSTMPSNVSPLTVSTLEQRLNDHVLVKNEELEPNPDPRTGNCRPKRQKCQCTNCNKIVGLSLWPSVLLP